MPQLDGALVTPNASGATNWPPPTYSPQTGLFYVGATRSYSVFYIFDTDENPQGWGGAERGGGVLGSMVEAIDYKTGKIRWTHKWESGGSRSGLMSTAGNLVFTGDGSANLVALDATHAARRCGTPMSERPSATAPSRMSWMESNTSLPLPATRSGLLR